MRVIAGKWKGRPLQAVPGTQTRPTTDRVKESLFSMIGPFFPGGICLDLYAGTGSLGIEALSRGMERAIFVDINRKAVEVIRKNLSLLGAGAEAEVYQNDAERALGILAKRGVAFDLVFLDPPYAKEKNGIIIEKMLQGHLLRPGAVVVVEHDRTRRVVVPEKEMELWKEKQFGDTMISVLKKMG